MRQVPVGRTYPRVVNMYSAKMKMLPTEIVLFKRRLGFTSECLHSLRSAAHADVLHVPEHLLEVVGAGAKGEVVQHVLLHVLDVRVGDFHLLSIFAPVENVNSHYLWKIRKCPTFYVNHSYEQIHFEYGYSF